MVEYQALEIGEMINMQSLQEVEHTPNMDQHVNESPQQRSPGIDSSCPPSLPRLSSAKKGLLDISMWMKVVCQALKVSFPNTLPRLSSARKRTRRCIHVDESCLSGLEGKFFKFTIDWQCSKLMKEYFESKGDAGKCQLLLCLLKSNCLVVVRRILGIKMVRSSEANNRIVRNL